MSTDELARIDGIIASAGDADEVLRAVVEELAASDGIIWAGILFLENGSLELGPEAGTPDSSARLSIPISWQGAPVGELAVDGAASVEYLGRVAERISAHVLLGWDTGGAAWEP